MRKNLVIFINSLTASPSVSTSSDSLRVCKKCHAFCCTAILPLLTEQEKNAILDAGFTNNFIEIENRIFTIKKGKNGSCPYLTRRNTCSIQKVKPKLCKIWPVVPRIKNNRKFTIVIKCPLFPSLSLQEIQQAKNEAETIPQTIISYLWNIPPAMKEKYKRFCYEEI
jgi:Fe-S-cluster containining protein